MSIYISKLKLVLSLLALAIASIACASTHSPEADSTKVAQPASPTLVLASAATAKPLTDTCVHVIAIESLNVRDHPDYDTGAIVGWLLHGDIVEAYEETTDSHGDRWLAISNDRVQGWSSAIYLTPTQCP